MEHPYRVHSSIGFSFLQLMLLSTLAYPTPPPTLYHNIAVLRLMGTVYFTLFQEMPIYLKLECATILLEIICDALYIRYIIQDYTYLFGVIDIITNLLFCITVILSIQNGESRWSKISECFEGIRRMVMPGVPPPYDGGAGVPPPYDGSAMGGARGGANIGSKTANVTSRGGSIATGATRNVSLYTSIPTNDPGPTNDYEPIYTAGGRQPFKPSFYSSSWGREYIKTQVEREFDRIEQQTNTGYGDIGMVTSTDGATQYIRFDDVTDTGAGSYASIFISPYYDKNGNVITSFSSWTKADAVGVCLFIYNLLQFIYQLMMYTSIVRTCRDAGTTIELNTTLVRWLC
jgi:hypothetical protein